MKTKLIVLAVCMLAGTAMAQTKPIDNNSKKVNPVTPSSKPGDRPPGQQGNNPGGNKGGGQNPAAKVEIGGGGRPSAGTYNRQGQTLEKPRDPIPLGGGGGGGGPTVKKREL